MKPFEKKFRIVNATAFDRERFVLALMLDEYADDPDMPHSTVWLVEGDRTRNLSKHFYNVVATAFGRSWEDGVYSLGHWGEFAHYIGGEVVEEQLPVSRGPMRGMARVGDALFAVGGGTQAFMRRDGGEWVDIAPPEDLRTEFPLNILEAVDGYSTDEVYAAGAYGTIWYFDGKGWAVVQSATNLAFHAVCCGEDGTVWLCGQSGVMAKGRFDAFEIITADPDTMDTWGIAEHDGVVRAAAYTVLMRLDDDELAVDQEASALAEHFYDLQSVDGVLWSFAMKDVLRLDDTGWTVIGEVTPE